MAKLKKKILKSGWVIGIAAFLIASLIKLNHLTIRWKTINPHVYDIVRNQYNSSVVVAFWHGRLLMIPPNSPRDFKINVLISNHSDGELIARVQGHFGLKTVRGSTAKAGKRGKGGLSAIREMLRIKEKGEIIAITPDGPRGPARKVSQNALEILKKLEMPVIPVTFSCTKFKLANSWDSFMIAKPFGKGVFALGEPILPQDVDKLEEAMNKLTDEADFVVKTL
jgi:hypothetical protein